MELADQADSLRHRGQQERSIEIYRDALAEEEAAIHWSLEQGAGVKTLSVLHRSAASLAMDCRDWANARKLIWQGLEIRPPESVEKQLLSLLTELPLSDDPTFEWEVSKDENENALERGVEINGSLRAASDLTFDGYLQGDIIVLGELTIGKNADVHGRIEAGSVKLLGRMRGEIFVRGICTIFSSGRLIGELRTARLVIEEGASFIGRSQVVRMRARTVQGDDLGSIRHSQREGIKSLVVPG
jgi:cytoskeletal protein CcmA (bactofilin family)